MAIAQAYAIAMERPRGPVMERPRGPVFVSIPSDDWDELTVPAHAHRHTWDVAPRTASPDWRTPWLRVRNPHLWLDLKSTAKTGCCG